MRIFLLPISTRRTLLYCERLHQVDPASKPLLDRIIGKANTTWATWERKEDGWKKKLTVYGNTMLSRIPYQEWGLKTLPALNDKKRRVLADGKERVEVLFPGLFLREERVKGIMEHLVLRGEMHRKKLVWCCVGIPLTAPFALIPIIPNIPFFYLVFRAYSHWKAQAGAKALAFFLQKNLLHHRPTPALDEVYTAGLMYPTRAISRASPLPSAEQIASVSQLVQKQTHDGSEDVMVLQRWNGKLIAERFELPEMEVEIERAVEQVEKEIKSEEELKEEKREIERATGTTSEQLQKKAEENRSGEKPKEEKTDGAKPSQEEPAGGKKPVEDIKGKA